MVIVLMIRELWNLQANNCEEPIKNKYISSVVLISTLVAINGQVLMYVSS